MTRIKTYAIDSAISENDIVIGSDYENSGVTKNYTFKDIITFLDGKVGGVVADGVSIDLSSKANVSGQIFAGEIYAPNLFGINNGDQILPTTLSLGLENVDNTSDLNKPVSIDTQTALNGKEDKSNKNISNGYAGLGSDGKIISSQLPALVVSDTYFATSDATMIALTNATTGDICIRTDLSKTYILRGTDYSILSDWTELLSPTGGTTSVFGRSGAVTANANDYDASQILETSTRVFQTPTQRANNDATSSIQTQLNNKVSNANHTGDVTGSIGLTITNKAVTLAKMNDVATGTVFYRKTAGAGSPEVQTLNTLKTDLSLNNVNNTSDINKPVSTATQTALDLKAPISRTITINGVTQDLSANRSFTVSTVASVSGNIGRIPKFTSTSNIGDSSLYEGSNIVYSQKPIAITNGDLSATGMFIANSSTSNTSPGLQVSIENTSAAYINCIKPGGQLSAFIVGSGGTGTFASSVTATAFYQTSDLRLKDIISQDGDVIKFTWKDKRDKLVHIGYVAQEIQKINHDQVQEDNDGMLSVNYIEILVHKIKCLENRIKQLEK